MESLSENFTLEIDCAPGATRPDDVLPAALVGTELKPEDFGCVSKMFGNWVFVPRKEKEGVYKESQSTIADNLKAIYGRGTIRYASW